MYVGDSDGYGFNFARVVIGTDNKCKLYRFGIGIDAKDESYCKKMQDMASKFQTGEVVLVGVKDTGEGCSEIPEAYSTLTKLGTTRTYENTWRKEGNPTRYSY